MKVLVIGDTVGKPGRAVIKKWVPVLREEYSLDLVIVNGENIAAGSGLTPKTIHELLDASVDVITSGDHIFRKRELVQAIDDFPMLVRPVNYPKDMPGQGSMLFSVNRKIVGVINALGRVFMKPVDCPFEAIGREVAALSERTPIIIVDFHAEATSEKVAMGWFLNGKVSAMFGTHTHVPTADERVLDGGTAYITDVGMTGAIDSVIGRNKEQVLQNFMTAMPVRFELAHGDVRLFGAIITIDDITGKAISIERISRRL